MVIQQKGIRKLSAKQGNKSLPVKTLQDKALIEFDPFGDALGVKAD